MCMALHLYILVLCIPMTHYDYCLLYGYVHRCIYLQTLTTNEIGTPDPN